MELPEFPLLVGKSKRLLFSALMLIKLQLEGLLRIRNSFYRGHGDFELTIAKSAHSDRRDGSEPFEHPKSPLFHSQSFSQRGCYHGVEGPTLVARTRLEWATSRANGRSESKQTFVCALGTWADRLWVRPSTSLGNRISPAMKNSLRRVVAC